MCGIVGYIGKEHPLEKLLNGLKELEYRGYDSAGIAVLNKNEFKIFKATGKILNLEKEINDYELNTPTIGIAHTRWATHGKPTLKNTHPHQSEESYVVHNGIIENYEILRKQLIGKGYIFYSDTDTEIIIKLFTEEKKKENNIYIAFQNVLSKLQGNYALLIIDKEQEDRIFYAMNGSPLLLSISGENKYFASSENALLEYSNSFYYFEDGDYGYVDNTTNVCFNKNVEKEIILKKSSIEKQSVNKGIYKTYMEKEISEQSEIIFNIVNKRIKEDKIDFCELNDNNLFDGADNR